MPVLPSEADIATTDPETASRSTSASLVSGRYMHSNAPSMTSGAER